MIITVRENEGVGEPALVWVNAMAVAELAEEAGRCTTVAGRALAVFLVDGAVYALDNICPHQGGPLADGFVDGVTVTCPLHAWVFDLRTGRTITGMKSVRSYPVRIENGEVHIGVPVGDVLDPTTSI